MKGEITIKVDQPMYAVDMDFDDMQLEDKLELLHVVCEALDLSRMEIFLFSQLKMSGVLDEAVEESHKTEDTEVPAQPVHPIDVLSELRTMMAAMMSKLEDLV